MVETRSFVELKNHPEFEISKDFPWQFMRKSDGKIVKPYLRNGTGYYRIHLNNPIHYVHRLVAEQFLDNPDKLVNIDHINRDRADNRLENLRFVSHSTNMRNLSSQRGINYQYVDELPEGFEQFTEYKMRSGRIRHFNNLYVKMTDEGLEFITDNSKQHYRRLVQHTHNGADFVSYQDTDKKQCSIIFSRISKNQSKISDTQNGINTTQQGVNKIQQTISETENTLAKAILNLTEILKHQQIQSTNDQQTDYQEEEDKNE
jgi:hypothetical protein